MLEIERRFTMGLSSGLKPALERVSSIAEEKTKLTLIICVTDVTRF